jgi:hypothetical protein
VNAIPIYDDTVPLACTASSDELRIRIDQIERLRSHLTRLERTTDGILLHLPNQPDIAAEVASFTIEEKACCAFWGFAVTATDDEITLRWDGPPAVQDLFEELVAFVESDQPLTDFSGFRFL